MYGCKAETASKYADNHKELQLDCKDYYSVGEDEVFERTRCNQAECCGVKMHVVELLDKALPSSPNQRVNKKNGDCN